MSAPAHHLSLVYIDVCEWRRQIRGRALLKEKVVAISTSTKEGTAKGKGFDNLRELKKSLVLLPGSLSLE